jgi:hypothetical protein
MEAIVRKRQQRKLQEPFRPERVFHIRGQEVAPAKIERWMHDNCVSESALFAPSPAARKSFCPVGSISSRVEATPSVIDCRTISEPGTPASRSTTPVPVLHDVSIDSAVASAFHNRSDSDQSSPGGQSSTPTSMFYERPAISSTEDDSTNTDYHNSEEQAIRATPGRNRTSLLTTNVEPSSSSASSTIQLRDVNIAWVDFRSTFRASDLFQSEARLTHCMHTTNQYIQESPDSDVALRKVLDLSRSNQLFIPTYIGMVEPRRAALQYWLSIGLDINERDSSGYTILLRTCNNGYTTTMFSPGLAGCISILIEHGANVHSTDLDTGRGALHFLMNNLKNWTSGALTQRRVREVSEVMVLLLEAGCDPDARDFEGETALEYALHKSNGRPSWEVDPNGVYMQVWNDALAATSETRKLLAEQRRSTS